MSWTIIGGGIQAVTIALKLRSLGLAAEDIKMIDPNPSLCDQFNKNTHRIKMHFLRSPFVHHVHPEPFHLKQFAKAHQYTGATYGKYKRPQLDMFMDHTHELVHTYNLNDAHIQGKAQHIDRDAQQWTITLEDGRQLHSDYVIIASGCNHMPYIPDMYKNKADVQHIFSEEDIHYDASSHVVGSGISAAHLTIRLLTENPNKHVHLWMKKDIEIHDFDADPGWLGPKNMHHFLNVSSSKQRVEIIQRERHKGSMPHELYLRLKKYQQQGRLTIRNVEITAIKDHQIHTETDVFDYDHILLATGYLNTLMTQQTVRDLIEKYDAPLSQSGFPSISYELEWLPQLYVAGGLADLELGPFARNIMGGREAANRIGTAFQQLNTSNVS